MFVRMDVIVGCRTAVSRTFSSFLLRSKLRAVRIVLVPVRGIERSFQ